MLKVSSKMADLGATLDDLADALDVAPSTVDLWLASNQEFSGVIKESKARADAQVERSLFERAMGFEHASEEIFCKGSTADDVVRVNTRKKYAPDTAAAIFWLKNRKPAQWRDKVETEHSGSVEMRQSDPNAIANQLVTLGTQYPTLNPVIRDLAQSILDRLPALPG
jgi:hypothetical protein